MIVTFLYRIRDITYYGKYIGYVSDDYEDGLDIEIQRIIYPYLQHYYQLTQPSQVNIGILFYQSESYTYFSPEERNVFQFLLCNFSNTNKELYLHGVQQKLLM
jgi:hypothetical protein